MLVLLFPVFFTCFCCRCYCCCSLSSFFSASCLASFSFFLFSFFCASPFLLIPTLVLIRIRLIATTGDADVTVVLQKTIVVAVVEFLALILVKPALRKETRRVTNSCKVEWLRKYMKGE